MARDLCFTPAVELARLYRTRKVSPLEVMQAVLERLDQVNPTVNAFVTVDREGALREARRATAALARRGAAVGPLHGIPVGIKDVTLTKGMRTTFGSKLFEDHVPDEDAAVVERLEGGRRHRPGQDQHAGVRLRPEHRQRRLRRDPQPVEPRAERRRIERRVGRRAGHGHVPHRAGHGSRRLAAGSRRRCAAWSASGRLRGSFPAIRRSSPGTRIRWKGPWRARSAMRRSCSR